MKQGDVVAAILSNYMVDVDWLVSGEFFKLVLFRRCILKLGITAYILS